MAELSELKNLQIKGLMVIPHYFDDVEKGRAVYKKIKILNAEMIEQGYKIGNELSMGMSHDFLAAILEGATYLRIGSAIFGRRN